MNQRMLHRGPDMQDYWCSEDHSIVLGHVRLSILDLSEAGKQPVQSQDGRYVMVWNGEIYNYESLRKKLVMDGRQLLFRGHSDTEVLIEYVAAYGLKEALKASTGMFAAAVFDRRTKKLCLCRDRMGEKPLYYGFLDSGFVFASDIGCIAEIAENSLEISRDALAVFRHRIPSIKIFIKQKPEALWSCLRHMTGPEYRNTGMSCAVPGMGRKICLPGVRKKQLTIWKGC